MVRRRTAWILSGVNSAVVDGTQIIVPLGNDLRDIMSIENLAGFTVTRMIINLSYKPTLVGSGHVRMSFGVYRVSEAAETAGQAAIPDPIANGGAWLFRDDVWVPNNGNEQSSGVFTTWSTLRSFDVRAARRMLGDDTLVGVMATQGAAATIGVSVNALWQLP